MRKIINTLSPQTRRVLEECYIHKKNYKYVAEELNVSVSAVRKHLVIALTILRSEVAEKNLYLLLLILFSDVQ